MSTGRESFNRFMAEVKSASAPPRWEDGQQVEENDLVLLWAKAVFDGAVRRGAGGGLSGYTGSMSPEDCLRRHGLVPYSPEVEQRMLADPRVRQWPEIVRGLPNPSNIAWGYSSLRQDYAGACSEPGRERGLVRKRTGAAQVRVIEFPKQMNDVLAFLGGGLP